MGFSHSVHILMNINLTTIGRVLIRNRRLAAQLATDHSAAVKETEATLIKTAKHFIQITNQEHDTSQEGDPVANATCRACNTELDAVQEVGAPSVLPTAKARQEVGAPSVLPSATLQRVGAPWCSPSV